MRRAGSQPCTSGLADDRTAQQSQTGDHLGRPASRLATGCCLHDPLHRLGTAHGRFRPLLPVVYDMQHYGTMRECTVLLKQSIVMNAKKNSCLHRLHPRGSTPTESNPLALQPAISCIDSLCKNSSKDPVLPSARVDASYRASKSALQRAKPLNRASAADQNAVSKMHKAESQNLHLSTSQLETACLSVRRYDLCSC